MRRSIFLLVLAPTMLAAQWATFDESIFVQDADGGGGPELKYVLHPAGLRTAALMTGEGSLQLVRTDEAGGVLWHRRVHPTGTTPPYWLYSAVPLPDNGLALLIGYSLTTDLFDVLRVNGAGELVLSKQYTFTPVDSASAIGIPSLISLPSGNLVLGAHRSGAVVLAELDAAGGIVWSTGFRPMPGSTSASPSSFALAQNGDLLVAGNALGGPRYIARLNATGAMLWCKRYYTTQAPAYDQALPLNDGHILWLSWPDGGPTQMAIMDAQGTIIDYWLLEWPGGSWFPIIPKNAFVQADGSVICEAHAPSFVMRIDPDGSIQDALLLDISPSNNWLANTCASWNGDSLSFAVLFSDTVVFDEYLSMELSASTDPHSCWLDHVPIEQIPGVLSHSTADGYADDPLGFAVSDIAYEMENMPVAVVNSCGGIPLGMGGEPWNPPALLALRNPVDRSSGISGFARGGTLLQLVDARGIAIEEQLVIGSDPRSGFRFDASHLATGLYLVIDRDPLTARTIATARVVVD